MTRRLPTIGRLRRLTAAEAAWRGRRTVALALERTAAAVRSPRWDRRRLARRLAPAPALGQVHALLDRADYAAAHRALAAYFWSRTSRFVLHPADRDRVVAAVNARFPRARQDAAARAERILQGRYDLLGYEALSFQTNSAGMAGAGTRAHENAAGVDWHLDPAHGRRAASGWWASIPYLDPAFGDHKVVWELNRHQHWLTLGRAAWLTGDPRHRARFVGELSSWMAANRPGTGVNWASMLEVAFRTLSWLWALHFFVEPAGSPDEGTSRDPHDASKDTWLVDLLLGLDVQLRHVARNLSYYFSPNTHLTGEALSLYVAGRTLPELAASRRWANLGRRILLAESARQIRSDGGHVECATHYHRYTLDFYLLALSVARLTADTEAEPVFAGAVARLAAFARSLADRSGRLPVIGDDDGGLLAPIVGRDACNVAAPLAWAAVLLPGRVPPAEDVPEDVEWLAASVGAAAPGRPAGAGAERTDQRFRSVALPDSGFYVMRSPRGGHMVIDAGRFGYLNGGHAHADALGVTLSLDGAPLLVDSGTGTYTMDPALRDRFRSTAAHNTLSLDDRPQAIPAGPFHWETMPDAKALAWCSEPAFDYLEASHQAYRPAVHRRTVYRADDLWLIVDHVLDRQPHRARVYWHIAPEWTDEGEGTVRLRHPDGGQATLLVAGAELARHRGDRPAGLGWYSPVYGRVVPCTTLVATRDGAAPFCIVTGIVPAGSAAPRTLSVVEQRLDEETLAAFVRLERDGREDMFCLATSFEDTSGPVAGPGRRGAAFLADAENRPPRRRDARAAADGRGQGPCLRAPTPRYRAGGLTTNARFVHARVIEGRLANIAMVEGSFLEHLQEGWRCSWSDRARARSASGDELVRLLHTAQSGPAAGDESPAGRHLSPVNQTPPARRAHDPGLLAGRR